MTEWRDMSESQRKTAIAAENAAKGAVFGKIRAAIWRDVQAAGGNLDATMDNLAGWKDTQYPERWNVGVWGEYSASVLEKVWPSLWAQNKALLIRTRPMPRTDDEALRA